MIHGEMSELGDVRLYLFVNVEPEKAPRFSLHSKLSLDGVFSIEYNIRCGNFRIHQNSSYHDLNSMKKLIGIPQRSERSSDLGTCYIIMIGKFFSSCHTSNPKI